MVSLHTENVQQSFSYALPTNVPTNVHPDINISTDDEIVETNGYMTTPQVIIKSCTFFIVFITIL